MIKAIDSAKQIICLQSFLIQDNAIIRSLLKAVQERDVKVFILSSAEARLKETIEEVDDFIKERYIQLLDNKFKNHFVHRTAEGFHGKYIIVDPNTQPTGFLATNNFTENGFTKNPELAVELNSRQCEDLFKIFVYHFWEHSTDEQTADNEFAKVKAANKFVLPKLENILLTSPNKSNSLNETLLASINNAKKTISFSTFLLDKNIGLVKAILDKAKQNISVTLFCRLNEKQFNEQLKELLEAGIQIYFHPLTHSKSILVDSIDGFVFTANLTANGLDKGLEVGLKLNDQQTEDLKTIHQSWKDTFPTKAVKVANVKDMEEIQVFKDRKLLPKNLLEDKKEESKKIEKVADLLLFLNQIFVIKDNSTKTLRVKLTAEIEYLPAKYKVNGVEKFERFEILEVEEDKGKKTKVVVINSKFEICDNDKLKEWSTLKIYSANPQRKQSSTTN
ncbi:phospholipase D-like domain-containing protein [Kaistella chaponensis]|uniref:phospholipase D-like domain-containing protein n=1 Tax=Kaistella chaponensis TaxID=713588 RepID=UPI002D1F9DF2|nr:phosphatidylserine/phosphatidylglycerophosphate/cardiolipin synthase family protein [Kaistella chaponensis]